MHVFPLPLEIGEKPELLLSMYIQKNEKQMVVDIKQSMLDLGYEEFPRKEQ